MLKYLPDVLQGLHVSLLLTLISLVLALFLALLFTVVLTLKTPVITQLVKGYIALFTGTPRSVRKPTGLSQALAHNISALALRYSGAGA